MDLTCKNCGKKIITMFEDEMDTIWEHEDGYVSCRDENGKLKFGVWAVPDE